VLPSPQAPTAPQPILPVNSVRVTSYYKENVYHPSDSKIGEVADVLVDADGRVTAMIVSVGGSSERTSRCCSRQCATLPKDVKWRLVMNTSKDAPRAASGYTYDRTKTQWLPEGRRVENTGEHNRALPRC
jgi:sporulation protein YlmC with PRC-barrel domain